MTLGPDEMACGFESLLASGPEGLRLPRLALTAHPSITC